MSARIRIVVVDDHPVILDGLQHYFSTQSDFELIATCRDGNEGIAAVKSMRPDILVLDIMMPGVDGLAVLAELKVAGVSVDTIVLTATAAEDQLVKALQLGAKAVMFKDEAAVRLGQCIRLVSKGERYFHTPALARAIDRLLAPPATSTAFRVTRREIEVIRLAAHGKQNDEIAAELGISEATVKIHLARLYQKLGVRNRVELARLATEEHWIDRTE